MVPLAVPPTACSVPVVDRIGTERAIRTGRWTVAEPSRLTSTMAEYRCVQPRKQQLAPERRPALPM